MPRHWRIRYAGAKYHLTVRGNARQAVFLVAQDYERFLEQLEHALEEDQVVLYAYVLMANHFHLLVETPLGNVARFMQRLNTAYGMYFRFKHQRVGHCFQGRYGAKVVSGDDYVLRLTRYIHLNPVKTARWKHRGTAEKRAALEAYPWSSYRGYAGVSAKEPMVNYRWLELMGRRTERGNQSAYRAYLEGLLEGEDETLKAAADRSGHAVGDEGFAERTREALEAARLSKVETGDIAWPPEKERPALAVVAGPVVDVLGVEAKELKRHGRAAGEKKLLAIELLCELSSATQREVAAWCGYKHESGVGKQRRRLRERLPAEPSLLARLERHRAQLAKRLKASF